MIEPLKLKLVTSVLHDSDIQFHRGFSIGASDVASLMTGHGRDVIKRKIYGQPEPSQFLQRIFSWGHVREVPNANRVREKIQGAFPGAICRVHKADLIFQHPEVDYLTASPDFFICVKQPGSPLDGKLGLIETKTTRAQYRDKWETKPAHYASWQSHHQLWVMQAQVRYVIAACEIYRQGPTNEHNQPIDHRWYTILPEPRAWKLIRQSVEEIYPFIRAGREPSRSEYVNKKYCPFSLERIQ